MALRASLCTTVIAVLLVGSLATAPAVAEDLPPGFTDGEPVGGGEGDPGPPPSAGEGQPAPAPEGGEGLQTASTSERYFGRVPFEAVQASVSATSRACSISDTGLTALVLAPVFKESSAATTASSAPAPMTLSRYDEWSGTYSTTNNRDANYGLYAFENPYTPYLRAYWHPGIGIWQYDSAGVGAPFTAIERMHAGIVSADVAAGMAARYCNPAAYYDEPYTDQERRYAAWAPWGLPCELCQGFFDEMMGSVPKLSNINLVEGIEILGGVEVRTCALPDQVGTSTCWYVNPSVGVIQGATAWATVSPDGGSGPTVAPAPLSRPFYVVDAGTHEERHWVKDDTGYDISISARRVIGENARPRAPFGSYDGSPGLDWRPTSGLCDLTASRGDCDARPPGTKKLQIQTVGGAYTPVVADVDGDGRDDVLWYGIGAAADYLWRWTGSGYASQEVSIGGDYTPVVGDWDGDGRDEVVWYGAGAAKDYLWRWSGSGFASTGLTIGGTYTPVVADVDGDGRDEVVWYGAGPTKDYLWRWAGTGFATTNLSVGGDYQPFAADLLAGAGEEILWYRPGPGADYLWQWVGDTTTSTPLVIDGTYTPVVGQLDGQVGHDVLWYGPGSAFDPLWYG